MLQDFEGNETLWKELKAKASRYGTDDKEVTVLVNEITSCVADELEDYRSYLGGKMKIGLSGAAYMDAARGSERLLTAGKREMHLLYIYQMKIITDSRRLLISRLKWSIVQHVSMAM